MDHGKPNSYLLARFILDAVSTLHTRGYGRLKIHCYAKDGIGAWRHTLFASDAYPAVGGFGELPPPIAHGSAPGWAVAHGNSSTEVADQIERRYPELMRAARGPESEFVRWYQDLLSAHPGKAFEIEHPDMARPF